MSVPRSASAASQLPRAVTGLPSLLGSSLASRKRVQRYALFSPPPNIFETFFSSKFNRNQPKSLHPPIFHLITPDKNFSPHHPDSGKSQTGRTRLTSPTGPRTPRTQSPQSSPSTLSSRSSRSAVALQSSKFPIQNSKLPYRAQRGQECIFNMLDARRYIAHRRPYHKHHVKLHLMRDIVSLDV